MNYIEEIIQAVIIGFWLASFLLNTARALKAIELCKEILVLLNEPSVENQFTKTIYGAIYIKMFLAYYLISDNTNAITSGRKFLAICRECGDTQEEGNFGMVLAEVYLIQSMYAEAKELYERTYIIMREIGDRAREASCYGSLVCIPWSISKG